MNLDICSDNVLLPGTIAWYECAPLKHMWRPFLSHNIEENKFEYVQKILWNLLTGFEFDYVSLLPWSYLI